MSYNQQVSSMKNIDIRVWKSVLVTKLAPYQDLLFTDGWIPLSLTFYVPARQGGVEVAGWTVDREIRVRLPAAFTACGPSNRKEVKNVFGRPGTRVGVGSAFKRPLAAHGVGARQQE